MQSDERIASFLRAVLRVSGAVLLLALPAALMPTRWMYAINQSLLDHALPATPLVEYLTRSLSGLYACLGLITWFLANDVRRYAPVIVCKSAAGMLFSVGILVLDLAIGMPWYWTLVEGPSIFLICALALILAWRLIKSPVRTPHNYAG